jgi:hypothetical protein
MAESNEDGIRFACHATNIFIIPVVEAKQLRWPGGCFGHANFTKEILASRPGI